MSYGDLHVHQSESAFLEDHVAPTLHFFRRRYKLDHIFRTMFLHQTTQILTNNYMQHVSLQHSISSSLTFIFYRNCGQTTFLHKRKILNIQSGTFRICVLVQYPIYNVFRGGRTVTHYLEVKFFDLKIPPLQKHSKTGNVFE